MSDLFNTGVRPAVDEWLLNKSKETRDYGNYWSASSAGYCMRKVLFERLGVPKIAQEGDARKQRVFTSGHLFHDWIQSITKANGTSIAQEVELQDEDLMIRGHFDDLVLVPTGKFDIDGLSSKDIAEAWSDTGVTKLENVTATPKQNLILYDYKTVNSRSFMWAKKNGNAMSHFHRLQLGTYMYMLRKLATDTEKMGAKLLPLGKQLEDLTEARILKIEKDTLMMMEQQLLWTPDLEKDVVEYWKTLNGYWKNKKLPKCTCADFEGGFMAKEQYNGYYYEGEPCSLKYYNKCKKEGLLK